MIKLIAHDTTMEIPIFNTIYEKDHKLRMVTGNGLRPDIWDDFKDRFNIKNILEFYGATEGNVSLMNYDGKSGAI